MPRSDQDNKTKKYPFYYYLFLLLIPLTFFLLLEFTLLLIDYGSPIPQWIQPSEEFPDYIMLNPEVGLRYFQNLEQYPTPNYDGFLKVKAENTFRVFVMGGSTTAGFPYPGNGAFSRLVQKYLDEQYPEKQIEVINIAMAAINTYTLRDLLPGVVDQKPDLVMIYAGHNEYYGAFGPVSSQLSIGGSGLVNFWLKLKNIRTLKLLRSLIMHVQRLFAGSEQTRSDATLMARMVGEHIVPLNSDLYERGLLQFEENLNEILLMLSKNKIPTIIGRLVSNLKDQKPFISQAIDSIPAAEEIFGKAQKELEDKHYQKAYKNFLLAKDLDLLRFRAPEMINEIITRIAQKYNYPVANIDSVFRASSHRQIPGDELFTDHLHPNLKGMQLLGSTFINVLEQQKIIVGEAKTYPVDEGLIHAIHAITLTRLDSEYAKLRLKYLKNGWPFIKSQKPNLSLVQYSPQDYIDELALKMVLNKITWEEAHLSAALWFKNNKYPGAFEREMRPLIENTPFKKQPYHLLIDGLIELGHIDKIFPYLISLYNISVDAYNTKWLGIYYLTQNDIMKAQAYLEQSISYNQNDPQVYYNIAGVFIKQRVFDRAIAAVEKCLLLDSDHPGALKTRNDLLKLENE